MALTLYYSPMSSATRVLWAMEELGVPYERKRIHLDKSEQKSPEYLKINPNGKVPALVDGDARLFESFAIFIHLGERYGVEKGAWPKEGTPERAEALSWTIWAVAELQAAVLSYILHASDAHFAFPKDKQHAFTADSAKKTWGALMAVLDRRLEGRSWIVGKDFSLTDLAIASVVGFGSFAGKLAYDDYANVAAWLGRCQSRPSFTRAMAIRE